MKLLKALKREDPMAAKSWTLPGSHQNALTSEDKSSINCTMVWCTGQMFILWTFCLATALSTFWMMEMSKASWMASSKSFTGTSKKKANFFTWQNLSCWASVATLFHSFSFETTFPCHGTLLKRHRGRNKCWKTAPLPAPSHPVPKVFEKADFSSQVECLHG